MPNDLPDWLDPANGVEVLDLSLNHASSNGSFQLPTGSKSLIIVTTVQGGDQADLTLTGHTTGFGYYGAAFGAGAYEVIGVNQLADPQLDYQAQSVNGPGATWHVTALNVPPPSFISRLPAPWQAPTDSKPLNVSIPATSSVTWIAGTAARRLRLFDMWLHWETAAVGFGQIKGSGTKGTLQFYDQVATNFLHHDFGGMALDFGESLVVTNDSAGAGKNLNGAIGFGLD